MEDSQVKTYLDIQDRLIREKDYEIIDEALRLWDEGEFSGCFKEWIQYYHGLIWDDIARNN